MRNSLLLCAMISIALTGCEAESELSEEIASLSPSTAGFTNQEVVAAESDTTVEIELTRDGLGEISSIEIEFSGTATPQDYRIVSGVPVRFAERSLTSTIELVLLEDNVREGGESLILTLQDPSTGSIDRTADKYFVGITGGGQFLNDTGVISSIADAPAAGQDNAHGLDVTGNDTDGNDGMVFTAIDQNGNPVAPPNLCVRDEITGNTWSSTNIITDISWPIAGLHNNSNTYSWYNDDADANGGSAGARTPQQPLNSVWPLGPTCAYPPATIQRTQSLYCDTQSLVDEFNLLGTCGSKDWRLPTLVELLSIVDFEPEKTIFTEQTNYSGARDALAASDMPTVTATQLADSAFFQIISTTTSQQAVITNPPFDPTFWPYITYGKYVTSTPAANNDASVLCIVYNEEATLVQLCNKQTPDMKVLLTRTETEDQTEN